MYRALSPVLFIYCNSAKLCLVQATADVDEILVMCRGKRVQAPSCVTEPDPGRDPSRAGGSQAGPWM